MNRSGKQNPKSWKELSQKGLGDEKIWDKVDHCDKEFHIVQVLELRCNVQVGDVIHYENSPWEICKVWYARNVADGKSILLYAHPTKVEIYPMTEDEWHELYGHMDLAPRS